MFYRHVSAIYVNSLLSLGHSLILYSIEMISPYHSAMFLCAFVTHIIKIFCYCVNEHTLSLMEEGELKISRNF